MKLQTSNIHRDAQHNKHGLGFVEFLMVWDEISLPLRKVGVPAFTSFRIRYRYLNSRINGKNISVDPAQAGAQRLCLSNERRWIPAYAHWCSE